VIFRPKSEGNWPFLHRFCIIQAALKANLTSLTLSTTTPGPGPGTPPANSRRTKQFLSHPHGLIYYILYYIYYIYIYIYRNFRQWSRHEVAPLKKVKILKTFIPYYFNIVAANLAAHFTLLHPPPEDGYEVSLGMVGTTLSAVLEALLGQRQASQLRVHPWKEEKLRRGKVQQIGWVGD
jgi:hypothetical protein